MTNFILETRGLTKRYGGVHALEDANFTLAPGEHVAVVGDNGAGKSTFVRQITGVEQRSAGQIFFDGHEAIVGAHHKCQLLLHLVKNIKAPPPPSTF